MFILCLLLVLISSSSGLEHEYLGLSLGSLRDTSLGLSGHVWLANSSTIQISDFSIEPHQKQELAFAFISDEGVEPVRALYKIGVGNGGEEILVPMKKRMNNGIEEKRLVAIVPKGNITEWKRFGLVAGKSRKQLSVVSLNKSAPQPFCCIPSVIGVHYSAATGPILVENSKTLLLQKFSLEANKAPDAWIFTGKGEIRQTSGKKARVLGRDTQTRHCSLREFYSGTDDLRVQLAPGQDIYQIDYLSLFCYQYDVDFGHTNFNFHPDQNPVPAYIPGLSSSPSSNGLEEPELLESNDLEGTC